MKKLSEKEFKKIYTKVPRITIDLIIVKGKTFLLTKRSIKPFNGLWHFPGGTVLYKEKIEDTISRVAKEELGIKIIQKKFLGYIEVLNDGFRHSVSLAFKCSIPKNQTPKPLEQADELKFFNKIPKKMIPIQEKFLKSNLRKVFQ